MSCFKCYVCGLVSQDQKVINKHMKSLHNIKVEVDETAEKFTCSMCEFKHGDMDALKNHMINVHKKDQWNWGLETKAVHICDECTIEFPTKQALRNHIDSGHKEVNSAVETDDPDDDFSESDFNDLPDLYEESAWTTGCNFKSRTAAFEKAATGLRFMLKKSAKVKKVGDLKLKVHKVVVKKDGGRLADIEITDYEGSGHVQFQTFGTNKKTKMTTVQVDKSKKGEVKHVQILATKVVKPILDQLLNGSSLKNLMKSFFSRY